MFDPEGNHAGTIEKQMLLARWANHLREESFNGVKKPAMIIAGLGKPTFPLDQELIKASINYWQKYLDQSIKAKQLLADCNLQNVQEIHNKVAKLSAAISYGHPQGDQAPREKIASALARWYNVPIEAKNIIFTVGGIGALKIIFNVLNKKFPNCRIMTPYPYYPVYAGTDIKNRLHPIHVMREPGYRLTAHSVQESLQLAKIKSAADKSLVKAFLLCDPNNPLGTLVSKNELIKIAAVLRQHPDIYIILDEAYAEMRLDGEQHCSLLSVAPDLKNRIILMRSATKGMSAAGERMAVIISFDKTFMAEFIKQQTDIYVHPPRSSQLAFAVAMECFDESKRRELANFYRPQVEYVLDRLKSMGAAMPDQNYNPGGTFYVVGDFSELLGLNLPLESSKALNKAGVVQTAEDIAYYLLFKDGVMLTPLSYCGLPSDSGYMRITCSGGIGELTTLMDRLEQRLLKTRKIMSSKFSLEFVS